MNHKFFLPRIVPVVLLAFFVSGCLEQETKTTIHPDGTCERVITVSSGDSPFPLHWDSSWDTSRTVTGKGSDSVSLVLRKTFPSYDGLSEEYVHSGDEEHFGVRVDVVKKFRWFFTYYDYRETYRKFTRDTMVAPETILTHEEMRQYTYGDTSKGLKDKVEEWHNRNLYEILFRHVEYAAALVPDDSATLRAITGHKEDFYRSIFEHINNVPSIVDSDGVVNQAGLDSLVQLAQGVFGIHIGPALRTAFGEGVQATFHHALSPEQKMAWSLSNSVTLPGIILDTNAPEVKGNTATWKLGVDQLSLLDYEMRVESRTVNVWATILTGAVVLLLVALLIWRGVPAGGRAAA